MSEEPPAPIDPPQPLIIADSQAPIITISEPYEYGRYPYLYNRQSNPNNDPQLSYFVPAIPNTGGQQLKRWGCWLGSVVLVIMGSCIVLPILCLLAAMIEKLVKS